MSAEFEEIQPRPPEEIPLDAVVVEASLPALPPNLPTPSVRGVIGWFAIFIIIEVVVATIAMMVYLGQGIQPDLTLLAHGNVVMNLVLAVLFVAIAHGKAAPRRIALRGCTMWHALLGVLLVPALLLVDTTIANTISDAIYGRPETLETVTLAQRASAAVGLDQERFRQLHDEMYIEMASQSWLTMLFMGCLLPAIGEEILFRGFLGRGLVGRLGIVWGIVFTSMLFAVLHLEPSHVAGVLILGVVLHIVYLASGSLPLAMGVHLLNNLLVFGGYRYYMDHEVDIAALIHFDESGVEWDLLALCVILVPLILLLFRRSAIYWQLPTGDIWTPGYATAEAPPAELGAQRKQKWPSVALLVLFAVLYTAFIVRYGMIIAAQVSTVTT